MAVVFLLFQNARAAILRNSQFIITASENVGGTTTAGEGWVGNNSYFVASNNVGSLDGTSLGLTNSADDRATISGTANVTYNAFCAGSTFPQTATTNWYVSFLCRVMNTNGMPVTGTNFCRAIRQNSGTFANATLALILKHDGAGNIQVGAVIRDGTPAYAANQLQVGQTFLVVARHQVVSGADNDIADVWINPASGSLGADEANVPAAGASTSSGVEDTSNTGPGRFYLYGYGGNVDVDEFRFATTWAEVTPSGGTSAITPGKLIVTNAIVTANSVTLSGRGGSNGAACLLLASTDLTPPYTSWPVIASNLFDANGNFMIASDTATEPRKFFRVRQGGVGAPAPVAPAITGQPVDVTVAAGQSASFHVTATGTAPLSYQWYFDTNTLPGNATNATLTINSVQAADAGGYSVRVTNSLGAATSTVAILTVNDAAPFIITQPVSQAVTAGNDATFTVTAGGTAPLSYQWYFNTNTLLANATNATLALVNVQTNHAGDYSVRIANGIGVTTSAPATLAISSSLAYSNYNLYGFAQTTTGGGIMADTDSRYAKATNALSFVNAVKSSTVKVIEIMNDLDLGWNEIGAAARAVGPFRQHATALLHPRLITTGVSLLDIQDKHGLTIFSANGATIRHCCFNIKSADNIIIRNLKFDEMWEWDESTKGDYDRNDWDFIDLGNGGAAGSTTNIWIDHCTFTKAYDGICDIKGGANHITFSWNKYLGDDGDVNTNSFVWQQINALEANRSSYPFYDFLRNNGFSTTNIVTILRGHDKTHLMGATALSSENALLSATFHHQWYMNPWDRLPRLRAGSVHNYNIFADDSAGLDARRLRDTIASTMSSSNQTTLNNTYNFQIFLNGSISTENGAILVENSIYQDCLYPLRNNQTDTNNPTYTGKIMALNSLYSFRNPDGTTNTYTGSSTNTPGDTCFGPAQAPVIAFSWNLPGGVLPYSCPMDAPGQLKSVLTNATTGCGAGVLTWAKTNWLKTAY